jgi:hypothetical protein
LFQSQCFELSFQIRLIFPSFLLLGASIKKPPLELAFRGGAKSLQFNHGVKEIGSGRRKIIYLSGHLLI